MKLGASLIATLPAAAVVSPGWLVGVPPIVISCRRPVVIPRRRPVGEPTAAIPAAAVIPFVIVTPDHAGDDATDHPRPGDLRPRRINRCDRRGHREHKGNFPHLDFLRCPIPSKWTASSRLRY